MPDSAPDQDPPENELPSKKKPWPPRLDRFDPFRPLTLSGRKLVQVGEKEVLQVAYFPAHSTLAVEAHYFKYFEAAETQEEKAQVVAAFFREATPDEWPIADWAFEALRDWRTAAGWSDDDADRADAEALLKTVAAVVVTPWDKKAMADLRKERASERYRRDNDEEFDFELYQKLEVVVSDIRQLRIELKSKAPTPEERLRLLESIVLDKKPIPGAWGITFRWPGDIRTLFEYDAPRDAAVRFRSAEHMLHELLDGRRDRAVARLYGWVSGEYQENVRKDARKAKAAAPEPE